MTDGEVSLETAVPRRAKIILALVGLGLGALTLAAGVSAVESHGRPFPGLFVDPHGSFSAIWWPAWGEERPPLRFPDRLVAVDGAPLPEAATRFDLPAHRMTRRLAALAAAGREDVQLTFMTRAGPTTLTRRIRALGIEEGAFFFGLYALGGVFVLWSGLAVLLLARRRAGALAYAGWSVGTFVFMLTFYDYHSTARLAPLFSLATVMVQPCVAWLAYSFPVPPRRGRLALRAALVALTALALVAALALVFGPYLQLDLISVRVAVGTGGIASLGVLAVSVLVRLRGEKGPLRQELRSSAFGLAVVPAVLALGFVLAIATGAPTVHIFLPFLAPLLPLSVGYALIRHNILGTTAVLTRRMFLMPVVTGAVAAALVAWLGLHAALRTHDVSAALPWAGAVVTLVALGLVGNRLSERIFFAATARFRPTLQQLADDLASKNNLVALRSSIRQAVMRWLPTEEADVVPPTELHRIANRPAGLRRQMNEGSSVWTDASHWQRHLLVPMRSRGELRGVLVLAPKREAAMYTREDLDLLETIASLGAVALHNAEAFAELETMRRLEAEAARDDKRLALGMLGAEISHEIAYPLNFLRYLLREGHEDRPLEGGDLEAGREEIGRLERMFATLHKLKVPEPQLEPVLVLPRVRRALDLIREIVEENRLAVEVDVPPDLNVPADPDRLVQIFANLLRNAAQAVPAGGAVGVRAQLDGGGVSLEVWDEGPGVPEAVAPAIFNPFVSGREGGVGLGLAVTLRLVRGFGWNIGVRREGGRTVFGVEVPGAAPLGAASAGPRSEAGR
jgi:signal transduction histidine kinase